MKEPSTCGSSRRPSEAIRGHQRPSEAIRGNQRQSYLWKQQLVEFGNQRPSEAIRGHQRPSEAIRGNQRQSEAIVPVEAAARRIRPRQASSWHARGPDGLTPRLRYAPPSRAREAALPCAGGEAPAGPAEAPARAHIKGGHQRSSELIRGHQGRPRLLLEHTSREVIRGHLRLS
jgi:hypothetical protein